MYHKLEYHLTNASGSSKEFHNLLTSKNTLIKKVYGQNNIIISAPHHAKKGVDHIANGSRPADNNTGYIARNIADHLKSTMLVVSEASVDPNKTNGTYYKHTVDSKPNVLTEIHGHLSGNYDIEVSCGSEKLSIYSEVLAEKIEYYLNQIANGLNDEDLAEELRNITICGEYNKIKMKASHTKTIQEAYPQTMPYHIELHKSMRVLDEGTEKSIPIKGVYVSQAIAAALADVHSNEVVKTSSTIEDLLD